MRAIGADVSRAQGSADAWTLIKPSTTGVPGQEVRVMRFDPQGNLWIAARWLFWGECGLAKLSESDLVLPPHRGGGFDTGARGGRLLSGGFSGMGKGSGISHQGSGEERPSGVFFKLIPQTPRPRPPTPDPPPPNP